MTKQFHKIPLAFTVALAISVMLMGCTTETIEVTRIQILERRVIERIVVTVEVTRIQPVIETARPTPTDVILTQPAGTSQSDLETPSSTASTATPILTPGGTPTPVPQPSNPTATSAPQPPRTEMGESLLSAMKDVEQNLLSLQQVLNSDPLPIDTLIELYDTLGGAPTFSIPADELELESIRVRYRDQIDTALQQAKDLYNHAVQIQSGSATQTQINPTHLSLAQNAASASTSVLQALIRELESYLASLR